MRLIDADALYDFLTEQKEKETGAYSKGRNHGLDVARSALLNKEITPTIDAVPVIRCGECMCFGKNEENDTYCVSPRGLGDPTQYDFCPYGVRKDGDGNG